jgi:hypothetical protein
VSRRVILQALPQRLIRSILGLLEHLEGDD